MDWLQLLVKFNLCHGYLFSILFHLLYFSLLAEIQSLEAWVFLGNVLFLEVYVSDYLALWSYEVKNSLGQDLLYLCHPDLDLLLLHNLEVLIATNNLKIILLLWAAAPAINHMFFVVNGFLSKQVSGHFGLGDFRKSLRDFLCILVLKHANFQRFSLTLCCYWFLTLVLRVLGVVQKLKVNLEFVGVYLQGGFDFVTSREEVVL